MDYFDMLRHRLVEPLRARGAAAVNEIIQTLDDFHMSKDDWDTLVVEFGLKGVSAEWEKKIDGKVRAALTRQYNKSHQEVVKMRKSAAERDGGLAGSDDDGEEEEDDLVKREFHGFGISISLRRPSVLVWFLRSCCGGTHSFSTIRAPSACAPLVDTCGGPCLVWFIDAAKAKTNASAKRKSSGTAGGSKKRK